jgi:hypothetical protein
MKTKKMLIIFLFIFLSLISRSYTQEKKLWLGEKGIYLLEAEHMEPTQLSDNYWQKYTDISDYSGSGYIKFNGHWQTPATSVDYYHQIKERQITSWLKVDATGDYLIKVRNYHLLHDGDNDFWWSLNNSDWTKSGNSIQNEWTWNSIGVFKLEKGIHKFQISGRSTGFCIDRILIYNIDSVADEYQLLSYIKESDSFLQKDEYAPVELGTLIMDSLLTNSTSIAINFVGAKDDFYIEGYDLYKNGVKYNDKLIVSKSINVDNLQLMKEYSFTYTITDWMGNKSMFSKPFVFSTLDKEKPSQPANFEISNSSDSTFTVSWQESTDNHELKGYNVYLNEAFYSFTHLTTFTFHNIKKNEIYEVYVTAVDLSGNESRRTNKLVYSGTTGISTISSIIPKIYPNYSVGEYIIIDGDIPLYIEVYSVNGERKALHYHPQKNRIEVGNLKSGVYFIRLIYSDFSHTEKFIKD